MRGQQRNLKRKFNSIIIVINFKYMLKSKNDAFCILIFVNRTDNLRMLLTQAYFVKEKKLFETFIPKKKPTFLFLYS